MKKSYWWSSIVFVAVPEIAPPFKTKHTQQKRACKIIYCRLNLLSLTVVFLFYQKSAFKNGKPRRKCLFTWDFTNQMHIQLYVKHLSLYLTVKDKKVMLTKRNGSTELEHSFIWLPTKTTRILNGAGVGRFDTSKYQRSFPEANTCNALSRRLDKKNKKVEQLKAKVRYLKNKMRNGTCF